MQSNEKVCGLFPLVSIIVTCYNHERYIGECIKSLLAQTYLNIEILITDDCSPDDSHKVISQLISAMENRFVRTIYIQNEHNIGGVQALNKMLPISRGDYIKLLDGDDMLFPNAIEELVAYMEKEKIYGLVYSNYVCCDSITKYDFDELKKKDVQKSPMPSKNMSQTLYENDFIIAPTVLIRKEVYERLGLHDERLTIADWDLWLHASFYFEIGYLNTTTAAYRIVPDSMSHFTMDANGKRRLKAMIQSEFGVLDKYKDYPGIDSKIGMCKCCNQGMSIAVDLNAEDTVAYIKDYLRKNHVSLNAKMEIKYFLFKLGLWQPIRSLIGRKRYKT